VAAWFWYSFLPTALLPLGVIPKRLNVQIQVRNQTLGLHLWRWLSSLPKVCALQEHIFHLSLDTFDTLGSPCSNRNWCYEQNSSETPVYQYILSHLLGRPGCGQARQGKMREQAGVPYLFFCLENVPYRWAWWYTPVIPALGWGWSKRIMTCNPVWVRSKTLSRKKEKVLATYQKRTLVNCYPRPSQTPRHSSIQWGCWH
jgi:hypothetical protein